MQEYGCGGIASCINQNVPTFLNDLSFHWCPRPAFIWGRKKACSQNFYCLLLGSYYTYLSYYMYCLNLFWLIFTYTYRTMAFFHFLLGEKLKNWKFSLTFQIYVPYDLNNQACNIYKYCTYNRNLRVHELLAKRQ